ncbi:MAG: VWA domain-containing protein [Kofleriaceae bacterium]
MPTLDAPTRPGLARRMATALATLARPDVLVRLVIAAAVGVALWFAVDAWVDDRAIVVVDVGARPVEFLDPRWFHLVALAPFFYLIRVWSLTDLSVLQQLVQATLRTLVIAAIGVALARPSWVTRDSKVATVALVDVSDSVSEPQLAAARRFLGELAAARGEGSLQVVTFAEKPRVERAEGGTYPLARHQAAPGAGGKAASAAGAGTDIQAAMQLAYGLYPDGHLPRMVILSDGNQTTGDVAVESYRAKELGVKVSWHMFDEAHVSELRVVGLSLPDELKVGAPYDVTAEIWSTEPQTVTLALRQDEFPNPLEPTKTVELREGKNLVKFKSEAKRAGATTYKLRVTKLVADTETANNEAVLSAPVKGRPNVLYVEGGVLREPSSAGYLQRALQHEDIDVEVRGPRGLPSTAKELEKFDLVIVSDVPAHLLNTAGMNALDQYVAHVGGGLIMAGGEDSFGSGGYQGTKIEQIMPVRFDSEKTREQPNVAMVLVIDHSGSMQGAKLEAAKESARVTTEVLAPDDIIAVVVFDSEATTFVRPQRAANRMRISAELSRLQPGGGTDIRPGLAEAYAILQGVNAKVKHVILLSDGEAPPEGIQELVSDMRSSRITVSAVGVDGADRNLLTMITDAGDGRLYMVDDLGSLPRIFAKETTEAQKSQLVEDLVAVRVAKRVEAIEGTAVEKAPALHGYVTHQAQADRRGHPHLRPRRAHPRPLAPRRRHRGGVDQRREEPVERRLDPLERLPEVLGPARAHLDAAEDLRQLRPRRPRRRRRRPRRGRRGRPQRPVRQRARHPAPGHRPAHQRGHPGAGDGPDRRRPLRRRLPARALRLVPAQGRAQARGQGRGRVDGLGVDELPARVPAHHARPGAPRARRRGHRRAGPGRGEQGVDGRRRVGGLRAGPVAVRPARRDRPVHPRPVRAPGPPVRLPHDQVPVRRAFSPAPSRTWSFAGAPSTVRLPAPAGSVMIWASASMRNATRP